jgi:hypothetical protein
MKKFFKVHSELIFTFLVLYVLILFSIDKLATRLGWFDYYGMNFEALESITYIIFILIIWGFSNWNYLGNRSIQTLLSLSILDLLHSVFDLKNYYDYFFSILILNFIHLLINLIQWRKSILSNGGQRQI